MIFRLVCFTVFLSLTVNSLVGNILHASSIQGFEDSVIIDYKTRIYNNEIEILLRKAASYKKERNFNEVIDLYNKGLALAKKNEDSLQISLLHYYLGDAFLEIKNYTMAIADFESCLKFQIADKKPGLFAKASFYLGAIYSEFNNNELSVSYYKDALNAFLELGEEAAAVEVLDSIGGVHIANGNRKEALNSYLKALDYGKGIVEDEVKGKLSLKVGSLYLELKDNLSALRYLKQGLQLLLPNQDSSILSDAYNKAGLANYNVGNYKEAEQDFKNAMTIAKDLKDRKSLAESFKNLAIIYEKLNRKSNEIMYFKKYVNLKDSLLTDENQKRIAEIKTQFEVQNKQKAIEILEHQKALLSSQAEMKDMAFRNNQILLIFFASVLVLSILFVILLIRRHNSRRNSNLALQNHLAEARLQKNQIEIQRDIIEKNNQKLEEARKIIIRKNKLLEENNSLLERTINERTLELYKAYQKLSFHVDNTSLAVMEFNDRLELIRWSDQAEIMFGWSASEVLGKRFHEIGFVLEKDLDDAIKTMHDLLYGEDASISFLSMNGNKFGETLYIEWNTSVLLNKDGSVDSIMAIANNVSSRELAFEALQSSHRELDNFIYKASHDLRGPLARIQGVVNLGLMEIKDKTAKDYFNMLHLTANQLNNILSRLLMIYDINHHTINIEKISLNSKIAEILSELKEENKLTNINFQLKIDDNLFWDSDLILFQIIVRNMFDNAVFFQDKRKMKVFLETRLSNDEKLIVTIIDNGLGIPEDLQDKVFDMFFHGAAKSGGTGLGLYMARKAIERLGGTIQLISGQPRNTIFEIILPHFSDSFKKSERVTVKKVTSKV